MSRTICLAANTLTYPGGGGHRWVYLNWALGLRAAGCELVWFEAIEPGTDEALVAAGEAALRQDLAQHGLDDAVVLYHKRVDDPRADLDCVGSDVDLLVNLSYTVPRWLLAAARRSVLLDIDPGLTQLWIKAGLIHVPEHDVYFSIGEAAREGGEGLPDCGIRWRYTPPCVDLATWRPEHTNRDAPYTTVTHWWPAEGGDWIELGGDWIENSKRAGFEPFIELPARVPARLELAIGGLYSAEEAERLSGLGWSVRDASTVTATTDAYARYVRASRGEFSCAKPSVTALRSGWISDRSLCYLASGKPVVMQDSGEIELPDGERGLLRFRTPEDAARALERVENDYAAHSAAARALAEARFDAPKVATALLEQVL